MLQCIYMCTNSPVVNLIANVVLSLFSPELCKNLLNIHAASSEILFDVPDPKVHMHISGLLLCKNSNIQEL